MKLMTAAALVLLVLATPGTSQGPDDKLVVPGERIGRWVLPIRVDRLLQVNGPKSAIGGAGSSSHRFR